MDKLIKFQLNGKVIEEREVMRKSLLAANGKIIAKKGLESENLKPIYQMYSFYKPSELDKYLLRTEEIVKEIKEMWLIEISVEDGLLRTKDLAQTSNWIAETVSLIMEKLERAWGYCDYVMINNYFMMDVIDIDRHKK